MQANKNMPASQQVSSGGPVEVCLNLSTLIGWSTVVTSNGL